MAETKLLLAFLFIWVAEIAKIDEIAKVAEKKNVFIFLKALFTKMNAKAQKIQVLACRLDNNSICSGRGSAFIITHKFCSSQALLLIGTPQFFAKELAGDPVAQN